MPRRARYYRNKQPSPTSFEPPKDPTFWDKVWKFLNKGYVLFAAVFTILGWITFKDEIRKWFLTDRELYEEEYFIKGILLPDELLQNTKQIVFDCGSRINIEVQHLIGQEIIPSGIFLNNETVTDIRLTVINNRLFFSTEIRYLENEEIVGTIAYNHWSLFKPNFLTYYDDDKSLEVIDKQGNVVFQVVFQHPNVIKVQGYFIRKNGIIVLSEGIFQQKNKQESLERIKTIKKLHEKKEANYLLITIIIIAAVLAVSIVALLDHRKKKRN